VPGACTLAPANGAPLRIASETANTTIATNQRLLVNMVSPREPPDLRSRRRYNTRSGQTPQLTATNPPTAAAHGLTTDDTHESVEQLQPLPKRHRVHNEDDAGIEYPSGDPVFTDDELIEKFDTADPVDNAIHLRDLTMRLQDIGETETGNLHLSLDLQRVQQAEQYDDIDAGVSATIAGADIPLPDFDSLEDTIRVGTPPTSTTRTPTSGASVLSEDTSEPVEHHRIGFEAPS